MSHLTCTNCLQKSPAEARRCKNCGREFGRAPERPGDRRSKRNLIPSVVLLAMTGLILVGAWQWWPVLRGAPSAVPADSVPVPVSAGMAPAPEPASAAAESSRTAPAAVKKPPKDSTPRLADSARAVKDTAGPVAPPAAPKPALIDPAHQRYAQDYVKLRSEPSSGSAVLRVLQRGEIVTVDSLQDGWYRVVVDSTSVGFVDRQYLDTLPPGNP